MADPSIDDILVAARQHRRTSTVRILLRQDLVADKTALEEELAVQAADPSIASAAQATALRIRDLETEIDDSKVEFRFAAIGHRAWADLLADHPPTKTQRAQFPRLDFNPETFPRAAIAASATSPAMTVAQVAELEQALNDSQFNVLWSACLDANTGVDAPKSVAAGAIARLNGRFAGSATATAVPSHAASSSDVS